MVVVVGNGGGGGGARRMWLESKRDYVPTVLPAGVVYRDITITGGHS